MRSTVFAVFLVLSIVASLSNAEPWPIPPVNTAHPLGNNWGEYQNYGGSGYFHNGIDVITPDTAGAEVRAVAPGWVKGWGTIQEELHYRVAVCDSPLSYTGRADGWLYAHIDANRAHKSVGDQVQEGDLVGYLVDWPLDATFDHCHFARISDTGSNWMRFPNVTWWFTQNPLTVIRPNTDTRAPVFLNARSGSRFAFCRDNTNNSYLQPTQLIGDVDIIARIYDMTGFSTGDTIWDRLAPYQIDHMIRRSDGLVVRPWTTSVQFSNILFAGDVGVVYKRDNTCRTYGDYDRRDYYFIVTNTDGDTIIESTDAAGKWATAGVGDGNYWVVVSASDVAGNETLDSMLVTTANGVGIEDLPYALLERPFGLSPANGRGSRTVSFSLRKSGAVRLRVLDQSGRVVRQLCEGVLASGAHRFEFEPDRAGVYLVEMTIPGCGRWVAKTTAIR